MPLSDWTSVRSECTVDRQPDRQWAHTVGHIGPLGHYLLYVHRVLATSHGGGRLGTDNQTDRWDTGALSTVHTEGTDNLSSRGLLGHYL